MIASYYNNGLTCIVLVAAAFAAGLYTGVGVGKEWLLRDRRDAGLVCFHKAVCDVCLRRIDVDGERPSDVSSAVTHWRNTHHCQPKEARNERSY